MRGVSCHPLLPSYSFINVVIGFLVAWSPKALYLFSTSALTGFTRDASSAPCRPKSVRRRLSFDIVTETFQNRARWLGLFTDPLGASVRAGSGALGQEEEHSSRSS